MQEGDTYQAENAGSHASMSFMQEGDTYQAENTGSHASMSFMQHDDTYQAENTGRICTNANESLHVFKRRFDRGFQSGAGPLDKKARVENDEEIFGDTSDPFGGGMRFTEKNSGYGFERAFDPQLEGTPIEKAARIENNEQIFSENLPFGLFGGMSDNLPESCNLNVQYGGNSNQFLVCDSFRDKMQKRVEGFSLPIYHFCLFRKSFIKYIYTDRLQKSIINTFLIFK